MILLLFQTRERNVPVQCLCSHPADQWGRLEGWGVGLLGTLPPLLHLPAAGPGALPPWCLYLLTALQRWQGDDDS